MNSIIKVRFAVGTRESVVLSAKKKKCNSYLSASTMNTVLVRYRFYVRTKLYEK